MSKYSRGYVREDGMVYLRKKEGKEIWGTKERFEKMEKNRLEYMEKKRLEYNQIPVEKRIKIGTYNPETGLYFIRIGGNLAPIWGTKEKLEQYKNMKKTMAKNYKMAKLKTKVIIPKDSPLRRRRGDIDPVLNLVFLKYDLYTGQEVWTTKEKLNLYNLKEREAKRKRMKAKSTNHSNGNI